MGILWDKFNKFFEFPIKRYPICFHRPEDFFSTGEANLASKNYDEPDTIDMIFEKIVLRMRQNSRSADKAYLLSKFPNWSKDTLIYLQSLYMMYYDPETTLIKYPNICRLLDSIGNETPQSIRNMRFLAIDVNGDGRLNYEEFLTFLYYLDTDEYGDVKKATNAVLQMGNNISFINNLSLEQQLECGLF